MGTRFILRRRCHVGAWRSFRCGRRSLCRRVAVNKGLDFGFGTADLDHQGLRADIDNLAPEHFDQRKDLGPLLRRDGNVINIRSRATTGSPTKS